MEESQDRPQLVPKVWSKPDQLSRAKDFVKEKLEEAKNDHDSRADEWRKWNRAYRLVDTDLPDEGCKVVDPEPQTIVDTLTSNIVEGFLAQDPAFKFMPGEETDEEQADLMSENVADSLRRIQFREKFERSIRQLLIYGTCVVKTPRKREFKKVKVRFPEPVLDRNGQPKLKKDGKPQVRRKVKEVDIPKWDDTDWEPVSLFNVYPIGKGSTIEEKDGILECLERSFEDLKANESKTEDIEGEKITKGIYHGVDALMPVADKKLKVCEYWGKIPKWVVTGKDDDRFETFEGVITAVIDNDDEEEKKRQDNSQKTGEETHEDDALAVTEAGIRLQESPFWGQDRPYLSSAYTPVDDEFYGIGVIEPIFEKWLELNTSIRQLVDNKTLQLLAPTIEDTNANIQREVKLVKNARIKADDINGIKPYPVADFSANGYRVIASLKDDIRRVTGATDVIQGAVSIKDQSATEANQQFQQAGVRLKNTLKLIDERLFKPFIFRSYQHDMQFMEHARIIKVVGKEGVNWKRIEPEDIWGSMSDVITHGPTQVENTVIKTNKLINFLSIAARAPEFANVPELMKRIWLSMGFPESDAEKIVRAETQESEEDVMEEIEAMKFGQPVLAKPGQDHAKHIQLKVQAFAELQSQGLDTSENRQAFEQNIDMHESLLMQSQKSMRAIGGQTNPNAIDVGSLPTPNPLQEGGENVGRQAASIPGGV